MQTMSRAPLALVLPIDTLEAQRMKDTVTQMKLSASNVSVQLGNILQVRHMMGLDSIRICLAFPTCAETGNTYTESQMMVLERGATLRV